MSQQMAEPQSSFIYPKSVEVAPGNPNKRYFKIFLLNNAITRTIDKFGTRFKIQNVDVLNRDIDTFIGRPIIPFNKEEKRKGKHVDPKEEGIFQHRYPSKLDYLSAANTYYDKHGKAKIIAVYKPDNNLLAASKTNREKILNYDALCETEYPPLVEQLDNYENSNEMMYVSPGLVSLDSYYTDDGIKIVTQFAATHSHIVDEPAFTEPVAYIHKRTCNVDGKTCYFDLLTAAEEKTLNTNHHENNNMSSTNLGDSNVGFGKVTDNISNADNLSNQEQNGLNTKTEVIDSKGNVQNTITKNSDDQSNNNKDKVKKKEVKKEADAEEVEKVEKTEKTEKVEKVEDETKEAPLTASQLQKILDSHSTKIMELVEQKQNEKLEVQAKTNILGKFIDNKNEELKESYDFYNTLPITSDQLARVLEDSRFNPNAPTNKTRKENLLAASYVSGIRSTKNINPSVVNDNANNVAGRNNQEIHYDNGRGTINSRYRK